MNSEHEFRAPEFACEEPQNRLSCHPACRPPIDIVKQRHPTEVKEAEDVELELSNSEDEEEEAEGGADSM